MKNICIEICLLIRKTYCCSVFLYLASLIMTIAYLSTAHRQLNKLCPCLHKTKHKLSVKRTRLWRVQRNWCFAVKECLEHIWLIHLCASIYPITARLHERFYKIIKKIIRKKELTKKMGLPSPMGEGCGTGLWPRAWVFHEIY